jgi:methyl-accepting chemotaxis protein
MYQQEVAQQLNVQLADHIVGEKSLISEHKVNQEALKEIFHMLMVINPSIEVYLLDPQGRILNFSAAPGKVKRNRIDLQPVLTWLEGDRKKPVMGDDPRSLTGKKVFSAAPVPGREDPQGYLYVILGGETYDNVVQKLQGSYILRLSLWIILASILFALISGLVLFATLTRPLRKLTRRMEAFRREKEMISLRSRSESHPPRQDEIESLTLSFQMMAARIDEQFGELQRSDTLRRELIANVSHDLRTPLATLRG